MKVKRRYIMILLLLLKATMFVACTPHFKDESNLNEKRNLPVKSEAYGQTALHLAANQGDLEKVKTILASEPELNVRDSFGGTALHAAMFQDNIEIVQLLIDYGLDIDAQGSVNGYTPLHDAVWAYNLEAVKLLVENGADITITNNEDQTPLEKAVSEERLDIVEYLSAFE